jgi:hypothetical protein
MVVIFRTLDRDAVLASWPSAIDTMLIYREHDIPEPVTDPISKTIPSRVYQ